MRCVSKWSKRVHLPEGDERLSEGTGNKPGRSTGNRDKASKRQSPSSGDSQDRPRPRSKKGGDIGRVLRSVYDSTLSEEVPDDFLDLLGKLS